MLKRAARLVEEADPDGAFSKDAQNAAAEEQASGMSTGGSIKVPDAVNRTR